MTQTNDATYEQDVNSDQLTLVDLYADWCGPCKRLAPTLEAIEQENPNIKMLKYDTQHNTKMVTKFDIRGIPTVAFFKNGQLVDSFSGNQPKDFIQEMINKNLTI